jgi:hypothetical protein
MEEMRQKSLKGMQKRSENQLEMQRMQAEMEQDAGSGEDDNDAEWYRKEVGHDPETGKHFEIETFHFWHTAVILTSLWHNLLTYLFHGAESFLRS